MSVSSVGGAGLLQHQATIPPKVDRPNDGDNDAGDATKSTAATPAPGTGLVVNKSA